MGKYNLADKLESLNSASECKPNLKFSQFYAESAERAKIQIIQKCRQWNCCDNEDNFDMPDKRDNDKCFPL